MKALLVILGHSTATVAMDLCGHLFSEAAAGGGRYRRHCLSAAAPLADSGPPFRDQPRRQSTCRRDARLAHKANTQPA